MQIWLKQLSLRPAIINSYLGFQHWIDQSYDNTSNNSIDDKHKYESKDE